MYPHINKNQHFTSASESNKYGIYNSNLRKDTHLSDVRLTESKEGYHLELEIRGYIKDDFNFYFNNDNDLVLTTGKIKENNQLKSSDSSSTKHNYCYASAFFKKVFRLPFDVVKNKIAFDYKDHILSIDLFKPNVQTL
ncbi:Hsp20/alpha crystallin family protein [Mariniflexile gromovii]|uniref:Hsp20/alpha crystallin family protein n=1 Tax=Mariniflexile gromovii TaxID=362523 RepID=A0ABS4BP90_9FLAO|nr:Hsp20/alpha crystallin family protein [Mariniflexile gromovii]MBP0902414.1 Hsp20/alpha crystallin family protein [Mariniflexile gromovii]